MAIEYTTIEGRLRPLSRDFGDYLIFNALAGRYAMCRFRPKDREKADALVGRRVSVSGKALIDESGFPYSVAVDEFDEFADPETLPKFGPGEEIDITGGVDSAEFVRRLRNEDD